MSCENGGVCRSRCPGSQLFTTSGTFAAPTLMSSVHVLLVGGGGSGGYSDFGGAGGGYVACGNITLNSGTNVAVTVGAGGPFSGVASAKGYAGVSLYPELFRTVYLNTTNVAPAAFYPTQLILRRRHIVVWHVSASDWRQLLWIWQHILWRRWWNRWWSNSTSLRIWKFLA